MPTIISRPHYLVQRTGNGLSYTLERRKDGQSVFFQGDDANTFRAELDGLEEALGGYDAALAELWALYAPDNAEAIG